jgi:hypothetical protein
MRGSTRTRSALVGVVCLGALGLAAFLGTGAPAAGAAEGECPNEAIRIQQGSTHLPDCRAYELVNIAEKNQQLVNSGGLLSADGNRVLYAISGGTEQSATGVGVLMLADRTASGWQSKTITPPPGEAIGDSYAVDTVTPSLSKIIATANTGGGSVTGAPTLVRIDESHHQTVLHAFAIPSAWGAGANILASKNLDVVLSATDEPQVPEHQPGTFNLYEFGSGVPKLVGRLPDGSVPLCGVPIGTGDGYVDDGLGATVFQNRVSDDGRYTYFQTRGDSCVAPKELYGRDLLTETTTLISGPPIGTNRGVERFLQAASDGSWVAFRTKTAYDATDGNATSDVYRWSAADGAKCLTCGAANLNIVQPEGFAPNAVVSEDGTHIYLVSKAQVDGEGVLNETNLYVWRDDGTPTGAFHYIGPANFASRGGVSGGEITPDGNTYIFAADKPGLNALSGSDNGGFVQAYRYDDRDQSLVCVSCPADGSATTGLTAANALRPLALNPLDHSHTMTADGQRVYFESSAALIPQQDVNDSVDIYEWHNGQVALITDGVTPNTFRTTQPWLVGVSPDGRDLLFRSYAPLVAGLRDQSESLYDARVGGGFAVAGAGASCEGDACRGVPGPSPGRLPITPATFAGPGNLTQPRGPRRCPKGRKKVQRGGKTHCIRQSRKTATRRNG